MQEPLIATIVFSFFLFVAILLSARRSYRSSMERPENSNSNIQHYEKMRDKITEAQLEKEATSEPLNITEQEPPSIFPSLLHVITALIMFGVVITIAFPSIIGTMNANNSTTSVTSFVSEAAGDNAAVAYVLASTIVIFGLILGFIVFIYRVMAMTR